MFVIDVSLDLFNFVCISFVFGRKVFVSTNVPSLSLTMVVLLHIIAIAYAAQTGKQARMVTARRVYSPFVYQMQPFAFYLVRSEPVSNS